MEKRNIGCILEQGNRLNVDEAKLKIWKNNMNMVLQDLAPIYISGRSQVWIIHEFIKVRHYII